MKEKLWRTPLLLFLGSLLLQAAWIVALPPFRGIDEFDHAYRAAAVAHGQWVDDYQQPKHGRGDLVDVPGTLVAAAAAECDSYKYVGYDNCHPAGRLGHGMVSVASAAARYNPLFYWIVGTVARPFQGATSLYAMRITAAVLCSALLALTGFALSMWRRPRLATVALFVAVTPMVVYSAVIPAPNGVEMMSGLALWACLLGLVDAEPTVERRLLRLAVPMAMILATVRSLGPLWLGMILLTCAMMLGRAKLLRLAKSHRAELLWAASAVGAATLAGALWTITQGANSPTLAPVVRNAPNPLLDMPVQVLLWVWQTMGAFPTRDELAPTVLYAAYFLIFISTIFIALWRGDRRLRWAMVGTCVCSYAVPAILVLATYSHSAGAWQGRYELPYSIGIPFFAVLALTRRPLSHRLVGPLLIAGWLAVVVAQTSGVVKVLVVERRTSPLSSSSEWAIPPAWLVVALCVAGLAGWAFAARQAPQSLGSSRSVEVSPARLERPLGDPALALREAQTELDEAPL